MLTKQNVPINFGSGLDTKTDPKQVSLGKFLSLENTIFLKGGLLQKRNGYAQLPSLLSQANFVTTFNGDLTAIQTNLQALSSGYGSFVNRGAIQPVSLSTLSLIRNNLNQTQCDSVIASNGLICTVYTEINNTVNSYKYVVADSTTGQNILSPVIITTADPTLGTPRVFLLGSYFVIVYTNKVVSTYHLKYIAISTVNPSISTSPSDISTSYTPSSTVSFDGIVLNNALYLAWNGASSTGIKMAFLNSQLTLSSTVNPDSSHVGTMISVTSDPQNSVIWVSYYDSNSSTGYTFFVEAGLNFFYTFTVTSANATAGATYTNNGSTFTVINTIATGTTLLCSGNGPPATSGTLTKASGTGDSTITFSSFTSSVTTTPHQIISSGTILNITSSAQSGVNTIFYEVSNNYSYDSSIPTHYFQSIICTQSGTVGSATTVLRSVGLASKSFIISGIIYLLVTYQSPYQNTYFLVNSVGNIIAKLAYGNGGGYLPTGLPWVSVNGTEAQVSYLFKDLIQAVNKGTNLPSGTQTAGIYSQTGINLVSFNLSTEVISAEIGQNLNLTGGFLWGYDGYIPVEQNFLIWPDSVEVSTNGSAVTPTGTVTSGSNIITAVSSISGVGLGAAVSGTGIPANQIVTGITSNTITFGPLVATGSHSAETITVTGNVNIAQEYFYQFTYEWTDNQGNAFRSAPSIPVSITTTGTTSTNTLNVPTLRLTYKTANPVKLVGYRWSAAQEVYYQFTSIVNPILNDPTVDSITIVDSLSDAMILGNNILYTTGGVLEDIGPPSFSSVFLFDDRLWGIPSEDPNLLWYSKQVIEATPVEMSDDLTMFIPPSLGAQGPSGDLSCGFPMDDKCILFKQAAISYFNGIGPDNTGANNGYSQPVLITSTLGCSNQHSIVFMPNGLMFEFQSEAGNQIWLLGRDLSTDYIGAPVEAFTSNATVLSAVNIPGTNQVRFTMSSGITLMYDYYYRQWGTFVGIPSVSACLYQGLHTFINSLGQVFQENPGNYMDGSNPVLMSFVTSEFNIASLQGYERFYDMYLLGTYITPFKLQVGLAYNYAPAYQQQILVAPTNYTGPVGSDPLVGQTSPVGGPGNLFQWRLHPQQQLCQSFRIEAQEVFDPTFQTEAGAGFTLSSIICRIGVKKGVRPIRAANQAG